MLRINQNGLKAPAFASLALAFASFGDAFLYPFLPVNNSVVGVPVVWVGVLLSINRFVRLVSNRWMVHLFSKYGLRTIFIVAVIVAIASTVGYAFAASVLAWLFLRICWGLAFSALRIGTVGYALHQDRPGFALGISKSLQETGPMVALFISPFLLKVIKPTDVFVVLSLLSMPALFFAFKLPITNDKPMPRGEQRLLKLPSTINSITLVAAIVVDGMMVVMLGVLFMRYRIDVTTLSAIALTAFYLGYRRICLVFLAPLGGWIADRVGIDVVFNVSICFVITGLLILAGGWVEVGTVVVFTFYGINSAVTPGAATKGEPHSLSAVAENATWRDFGAAAGTLCGGFLITSIHVTDILLIPIFMLVILLVIHLGKTQKALKTLTVWK